MRGLRSWRIGTRVIALTAVLYWAVAPSVRAQGAVDNIASELICLCGCNKLLSVCEMDTATQMKQVISAKLAAGWDKAAIIDYMTQTYGEQVLAAPTKRGFNLTAWITPFALIGLGSVVIWLGVAAWVRERRTTHARDAEIVQAQELESAYGERLERELREFEA